MESSVKTKFSKFFASPTEKFVCALGNSYAETFLANGMLSNGFSVLSDKRVYFKGSCYSRIGKKFTKTHEEKIVDIKDVTGTGFVHFQAIALRIAAIVCTVIGGIMLIPALGNLFAPGGYKAAGSIMFIFSTAIPVALWVGYFKNRRSLFEISFAGGGIAFDTVWLNQSEIQSFQKSIRLAKDAYEEQRESRQTVPVVEPIPALEIASGNIADELKKYKELLDGGIISAEEFENAKSKLLGKL